MAAAIQNNWAKLQIDPFNDKEKSIRYLEQTKILLDKSDIQFPAETGDWLYSYKSLNEPKSIRAIKDLAYIGFTRDGYPDYAEIEKIISNFKDDNTDFLKRFEEILVFYDIARQEKLAIKKELPDHAIERSEKYAALTTLFIDTINDKLKKVGKPLLNYPRTVFERNNSSEFTIAENKGEIAAIEMKVDKKIIGLSIWDNYDGKVLSEESYRGLCNSTSERCIIALRRIGIDAYPYAVGISVNAPFGRDGVIGHYVALVNINNTLHIYDMPQSEFIEPVASGFRYTKNFLPRFIELTKENLVAQYGITEQQATKNIASIFNFKTNNYSVYAYISDTSILK